MSNQFISIVPLLLIFAIFYFLLLRPQQKRAQNHRDMIKALRRGDGVTTAGGIIAKVIKVMDDEVEVEVAENVRVRLVRDMIAEVRSKSDPVTQ